MIPAVSGDLSFIQERTNNELELQSKALNVHVTGPPPAAGPAPTPGPSPSSPQRPCARVHGAAGPQVASVVPSRSINKDWMKDYTCTRYKNESDVDATFIAFTLYVARAKPRAKHDGGGKRCSWRREADTDRGANSRSAETAPRGRRTERSTGRRWPQGQT